jgi:hypothetical protein
VTDGGDRLPLVEEVPDDVEDRLVGAEVLGCAAAGDDERVVVFRTHVVERRGEFEVVPPSLQIGLVAAEVVDGRLDHFSRLALGADGVDLVADHPERLERHHDLVVFAEVADDHEDVLA